MPSHYTAETRPGFPSARPGTPMAIYAADAGNRPGPAPTSAQAIAARTTLPRLDVPGQDVGGFAGLAAPGTQALPQMSRSEGAYQDVLRRQRSLLGPFGELLPEGFILRQADVPSLEFGLEFQQRQAAMEDRQTGIERLESARAGIGISPESTLARELAVQRASGGGPLGQQAIDDKAASIKAQGAVALQDQQRSMAERFARQRIGGAAPAYQQALLEQNAGIGLAGELSDFGLQSAALQEEAQRSALQDLQSLSMEEEFRRTALDQLIAQQYLNTERTPMDMSGLLGIVPYGATAVGGGLGRGGRGSRSIGSSLDATGRVPNLSDL